MIDTLLRGFVLFSFTLAVYPVFGQATSRSQPSFFDGVDDEESRAVMVRARERIESIRKGDLQVRFIDSQGASINAAARINLVRHDFLFGTALTHVLNLKPGDAFYPARSTSLEVAKELFNTVTINCHWGENQITKDGQFDWSVTDQNIQWAIENGFRPRMHALIYMNESYTPKWKNAVVSTNEWWELIDKWIQAVAERYDDKYIEFDVINEMFIQEQWRKDNNPLFPVCTDPNTGARIFEIARKYLPNARLMPLDQSVPTLWPDNVPFQRYIKYCKELIYTGATVDAIGYQGHNYTSKPTFLEGNALAGPDAFRMKEVEKGFDLLASLGKPIHITEFNPPSRNSKNTNIDQARLSDEEVAAWTVNYYTLLFSKPYIGEITRWFVADLVGGRGLDAGLVTTSGVKKASYYALKKLLQETWASTWHGQLTNGTASMRAFYGEYTAQIEGYDTVSFSFSPNNKGVLEVIVRKIAR